MNLVKKNNKVLLTGMLIIALLALFGLIQSPLFNLRQIEVAGNKEVSRQDILALANIGLGTNIFQISPSSVAKSVAMQPLIKSVDVTRQWPDTLVIKVAERQPVAMIPVQNGFVKVDEQGVFLERTDVWPKQPLPIISGIKIAGNLNLGQTIDNQGLLETLQILTGLPGELYPMIGELYAADSNNLVMYTRDGLEIRLGEADKAKEKFAILRQFLLDKDYKNYRMGYYVDLSSGQPVLGHR